MLKERFRTIYRSGISNVVLFIGLFTTIVLLSINIFFPIAADDDLLKIIAILVLTVLGELLFLKLEDRVPRNLVKGLKQSGVVSILPSMKGDEFEHIMSRPGDKIILNTWIFNFDTVSPLLKQSLKSSDTSIEIIVLDPESGHAIDRGHELKHRDAKRAINDNLDEWAFFLASLSDAERQRVKIYKFNSVPKITIYGCGKKAFVGFFWPGHHAAHSPQLLIDGDDGHFSRNVWEYYSNLSKKEITKDLLNKVPEIHNPQ
jgi:hypothetical protein